MRRLERTAVMAAVLLLAMGSCVVRGEAPAQESPAYAAGTRALDEQRWADAVADFDRVVDGKAKRADAALYWKAYALNKLRRGSLVSATCAQLHSDFAGSTWNRDCLALQIGQDAPRGPSQHGPEGNGLAGDGDADLKFLALNSLINRDPAQAMPYLRRLLASDQPMEVKRRAMFVLAQSSAPEAQALLHDLVMGRVNPDLQEPAIQMYGVFRGKRGNDTLAEVYRSSTNAGVKRSVVSAFFVTGDAARLVDLARNEKDLDMKRTIVSQLALMQDKAATDYMLELLK